MNALIKEITPDLIDWRRDLHAHPELAYQEHRTSSFVIETLKAIGCEVTTGIAKTGVVGVLDFGPGPTLGIRADMDALPLEEATGADYASKTKGIMHACGHDGHTVMALGAAKVIAQAKDLKGKVVFVFQPAEENEGGAKAMVEEGLFTRFPMGAIFGLHNMPNIPVGEIWARPGAVSAAFDTFDITLTGKGGHGAMPENASDPIVAAAALVSGLNTIVSRNIAPLDSAVLSICALNAGEAYNVIPQSAHLRGSCRSFKAETQALLKRRIQKMTNSIADAHGVTPGIVYEERYPAVINSERETKLVQDVARGAANGWTLQDEFDPMMGSEDFSFYLKECPGSFFVIGNGSGCGPLHSPTYNFNDDALPMGVGVWTALAQKILLGR